MTAPSPSCATNFQGKRLKSLNDIVVKSDGSISFTHPTYGIDIYYADDYCVEAIGGPYIYRINEQTGALRQMTKDFVRPSGIAFSPDETVLYIVDIGVSQVADGRRHIQRF